MRCYIASYSYCDEYIGLLICGPDHLCFEWTNYDKINSSDGTTYAVIISLARPLSYM